jgi:propanol-preferring alcohol dehydrogenase
MNAIQTMRAMVLEKPRTPLVLRTLPVPKPAAAEVLLKVLACAVCRTDLHVVDGELGNPKLPLIIGHEIVGQVARIGPGVTRFAVGDRVGVPWLGWTCGECAYCLAGNENLCDRARFTGYTIDGGYAEFTMADSRFCTPLPMEYADVEAAPLLCAGLIGYRCLVRAGNGQRLGIYGFGAAAHIVVQVAIHQGRSVYAFTRPGDDRAQQFARSLGATWAGGSDERAPEELDAAIIFAPVGSLVLAALASVRKGGAVVCGGIHMSDVPSFPYELLWGERTLSSVANLTRVDADAFMKLAPKVPVRTTTQCFALEEANEALERLRHGQLEGAAVLQIAHSEKS